MLGMSMGHNFKGTGIKTLNSADFAAGVASVYDGVKPEMTFDEAKRIVNEYFAKLEAEMQAEAAKQGEVNRKNGEAFLSENAKREGIKVTESGLQYEVLESGKGDSPKASDNVEVHYTGKLIDGTVFDRLRRARRAGIVRRHTGDSRLGRGTAGDARRRQMASLHPFRPCLRS